MRDRHPSPCDESRRWPFCLSNPAAVAAALVPIEQRFDGGVLRGVSLGRPGAQAGGSQRLYTSVFVGDGHLNVDGQIVFDRCNPIQLLARFSQFLFANQLQDPLQGLGATARPITPESSTRTFRLGFDH